MKHLLRLFAVLLACTAFNALPGQGISFTNGNGRLAGTNFHSGNSVSVVDVDNDGLDDIALLDGGNELYFHFQRTGQNFVTRYAANTGSSEAWAMVVGDVNRNGVRDVFVGFGNSIKFVRPDTSLTQFPQFTLSGSNYLLQNMNLADINNDGAADLWGCNDVGTSKMWGNNGNGGFPGPSSYFDPSTYPASDNSGNYGSIWTDVDNDGDVDLYVAHCRQGVNSPTDPRRINQLFINRGNNNYVLDSFNTRGLNVGAQTWTASFEDIDNDGDFDALLTNHDAPSQVLVNNGSGYFTDITTGSGFVSNMMPLQSKMEDFDNDGWVDILIAGEGAQLFRNNGNHTFSPVTGLFNNNQLHTFALGDLNHDGKIDLYAGYGNNYNDPSGIDDVIWLNNTNNANHFITFNLKGTASTPDALGAKVEIYGTWGKQVREVRAGESYGTTNSLMCHFGLGAATLVDSVVVRWPQGLVTKIDSLPANQFVSIVEGTCYAANNFITANGALALCGGQPLTASAPAAQSYLWSTGDTTQTITISTEGEYHVRITNANGCSTLSKTITVLTTPDETPLISVSGETQFCGGDSVVLSSTPATAYVWSTGDTTQTITVTQSGNYTVATQGSCNTFTSAPVSITALATQVTPDNAPQVCQGNSTTIQVSTTGTAYWYATDTSAMPFTQGNSYTTPALQQGVTYYVQPRDTAFGLSGSVGAADSAIGNGNYFNGNQHQTFDVYKPVLLKSVTLYAGSTQSRTIQLRNSQGTVVESVTQNITQGQHTIALNWLIAPGLAYQLGWAPNSNPNLFRNNDGAVYPYNFGNVLSVTGNSANAAAYWYAFYNWQVEEPPLACTGETVPVTVTVNNNPLVDFTGLNTTYLNTDAPVTLTPTPVGGTFSGTGVSGTTFSPAAAGTGGPYTITYSYTDTNGCTGSVQKQVTVQADTTTGINPLNAAAIQVYPNPSNGNFTLLWPGAPAQFSLQVSNALGQQVYTQAVQNPAGHYQSTIPLSHLSAGTYLLTVQSHNYQRHIRLFIR